MEHPTPHSRGMRASDGWGGAGCNRLKGSNFPRTRRSGAKARGTEEAAAANVAGGLLCIALPCARQAIS